METLYNGYTLEFSEGAFPLGTDSIALADFIKLPKNAAVLDLGSGCGTLGLLLCASNAQCRVVGMELDPLAHAAAIRNRDANALGSRLESICADLRSISSVLPTGGFSVCVSNPPYFSGGPASKTLPAARREDQCSMDELFQAAAWALQWGGDLFLVHRPERFAQLCACASKNNLEAKRVRLLRHKENGPVTLVLVQCRRGAKPGLIWEEASLYRADGTPTEYYRSLYHL